MKYIRVSIYLKAIMPHIARVFQSGNSQAVRLPKEFRFNVDRVDAAAIPGSSYPQLCVAQIVAA
jgi:hypothetical protein